MSKARFLSGVTFFLRSFFPRDLCRLSDWVSLGFEILPAANNRANTTQISISEVSRMPFRRFDSRRRRTAVRKDIRLL